MRDRDREMLAKMLVSPTSGDCVIIVPITGWQPVPPLEDTFHCAMLDFQRGHADVTVTTRKLTAEDVRRIWETIVLYNEALWKSV